MKAPFSILSKCGIYLRFKNSWTNIVRVTKHFNHQVWFSGKKALELRWESGQ